MWVVERKQGIYNWWSNFQNYAGTLGSGVMETPSSRLFAMLFYLLSYDMIKFDL